MKNWIIVRARYDGTDNLVQPHRHDGSSEEMHLFTVTDFITDEERLCVGGPRKNLAIFDAGLHGVIPEIGKVYLVMCQNGESMTVNPNGRVLDAD